MIVRFFELDRPRASSDARRAHLQRIRALQEPVRGERNGQAKLTDEQAKRIRELRASGERPSVLAARFAVDRGVIWRIVTRRTWTHV